MAPRKAEPFARQGYHHGNLKEALIAAARKLIAERGPVGFTLSEAARLAGVSAAAPYRHFKDRDALIAEVARRGFAAFSDRLKSAWSGGDADPVNRFSQMGEAYLAFAREEPGYYGAMFAGIAASRGPTGGETGFGALTRAIGGVVGGASGAGAAADLRAIAYQVWAMSHGVATLSAAGHIPQGAVGLRPETLLRNGVAALLKGSKGAAAGPASAQKPTPGKTGTGKTGAGKASLR